jgi:hypothetical protein
LVPPSITVTSTDNVDMSDAVSPPSSPVHHSYASSQSHQPHQSQWSSPPSSQSSSHDSMIMSPPKSQVKSSHGVTSSSPSSKMHLGSPDDSQRHQYQQQQDPTMESPTKKTKSNHPYSQVGSPVQCCENVTCSNCKTCHRSQFFLYRPLMTPTIMPLQWFRNALQSSMFFETVLLARVPKC